jgi:hypothetical protein
MEQLQPALHPKFPPFLGKTNPEAETQAPARSVDSVTLQKQAKERASYSSEKPRAGAKLEDLGFSTDDASVARILEEKKHVPNHIKMLRPPPRLLKNMRELALEKIVAPADMVSLEAMEAARDRLPLNLEDQQEQLLEGGAAAIRINLGHVDDDKVRTPYPPAPYTLHPTPHTLQPTPLTFSRNP